MNQKYQTALITGASGGIGLALTRIFAKEGYDLILVARSEGKLFGLKNELETNYGNRVWVCAADLAEKDAAYDVYNFTLEHEICVDVLVNNAGFGDFGAFAECQWQKQYEMVQVNIGALMQLTRCFLPSMIERENGKILNMSSVAAFQPGPMMSVYYASKAFVLSFNEALSVELRNSGVTVTALCPGPTKTGFEAAADAETSGLFKHLKNATAEAVAAYGYDNLMHGKVVAVPGAQNKLVALAGRLFSRKVVRRFVYYLQK